MTTDTQILVLFAIGLAGVFLIAWAVAETIVQRRAVEALRRITTLPIPTRPDPGHRPGKTRSLAVPTFDPPPPPPMPVGELSIFPKGERIAPPDESDT